MSDVNDGRPGSAAFAFGDPIWPGLAKLTEECGEVIQVCGKMMMVHGSHIHWSGNLREQLCEEMADVIAAIYFVGEECLTAAEQSVIADRVDSKVARFKRWHEHPEEDRPTLSDAPKQDNRHE